MQVVIKGIHAEIYRAQNNVLIVFENFGEKSREVDDLLCQLRDALPSLGIEECVDERWLILSMRTVEGVVGELKKAHYEVVEESMVQRH